MVIHKKDLIAFWKTTGIIHDERVLRAFTEIPREQFILDENRDFAYADQPLQILRGKTISQPTTVFIMTQALGIQPGDKILEVGTGSGYQSAILSYLTGEKGHVWTTEILPELVSFAKENIKKLGLTNITILEQDGTKGISAAAPFDKVILTAAGTDFPDPLIEQLKEDGLIIGPVGDAQEQEMVLGRKHGKKLDLDFYGQFLFSPLAGKYGFEEE